MMFKLSKAGFFVTLVCGALLLVACEQAAVRQSAQSITDTAPMWSASDSRLLARQMTRDLLAAEWLPGFQRAHNKIPVIAVGAIRNLGREQIDTQMFVSDLEHELQKSADLVRLETDESESAVDFRLQGSINGIADGVSGGLTRFYQVDLVLYETASNRKVWFGQQKIRKQAGT